MLGICVGWPTRGAIGFRRWRSRTVGACLLVVEGWGGIIVGARGHREIEARDREQREEEAGDNSNDCCFPWGCSVRLKNK